MKKTLLFGEPMALLLADTPGALECVEHFTRRMSGAEVNVAIGLTRLGFPVEYLTRLGDDPFGHYIEQALKDNGIGTNLLTYDTVYRTGIQLKEYVEDGHDPAAPYYRKGSAASHLSIREIDALDLGEIGLVHVTGIPPALSKEAREATYRLMERARKAQIPVTFDPNLRPALWENDEMMRKVLNDLANYADVVLPGIGECEILAGTTDKEKAADFYHQKGAALVVIKDGKNGAYVSEKKENGGDHPGYDPGVSGKESGGYRRRGRRICRRCTERTAERSSGERMCETGQCDRLDPGTAPWRQRRAADRRNPANIYARKYTEIKKTGNEKNEYILDFNGTDRAVYRLSCHRYDTGADRCAE